MISALTPLEFLARNAIAYRDCIAEVDGDRRFTYSEMQQRVHSFGAALQQAGIAPGDRVAVLARNGLLPLEAHFAVPLIGAVLVTLNIRLQSGELATILNHCGARILLGDADLLAPLQAIRTRDSASRANCLRLRDFPRRGQQAGRAARAARGRRYFHQLHQRHHRRAQRRDVHASRRLLERHRGSGRTRSVVPLGLPVDAAHVPLQRLVLHLGESRPWERDTSVCPR